MRITGITLNLIDNIHNTPPITLSVEGLFRRVVQERKQTDPTFWVLGKDQNNLPLIIAMNYGEKTWEKDSIFLPTVENLPHTRECGLDFRLRIPV